MYLGEYITRSCNRLKLDPKGVDANGVAFKKRIIAKTNEIIREIAYAADWNDLKRVSEIITTANYTTGTAAVTNGSRRVVGTGTVWTAGMQGRYFKPSTGDNWYKIAYVDTVSQILWLQLPIIEASSSGAYNIWKRFYYVGSDVRKLIDFGSWLSNGKLVEKTTRQIEDVSTNISNVGEPDYFSIFGVEPFRNAYSTGQVKVSKNSNVVEGSGTSFFDNVSAGDILTIANSKFKINRIETDTRLILENYSDTDLSTFQDYSIVNDNPTGVQYYYSPNQQYIFPYTYIKKPFDLVNETYDRPDLSDQFDDAILDGIETGMMRETGNPQWTIKDSEYKARITDLINLQAKSSPRTTQFSPQIPTRSAGY